MQSLWVHKLEFECIMSCVRKNLTMGFRKYIKCNVLKERTGGNIKMSERNYMEVYEQWVNNPLFGQGDQG